jgi:hypothetical protein
VRASPGRAAFATNYRPIPLESVMRGLISCLLATAWLAVFVVTASGAEIRRTTRGELRYVDYADVILEGKIEIGDYEKLLKIIDEDCGDYSSCTSGIFLASPGGDLVEAMKIGRLARKLRLATHVPSDVPPVPSDLLPPYRQKIEAIQKKLEADMKDFKAILKDAKANYMCASACFFIFVAGIDRERDILRPVLGIHRPYFSEADLKRLSGNQVIARAGQIRTVVEDYLKELGVTAKYADLMFSIPKDQIRFSGMFFGFRQIIFERALAQRLPAISDLLMGEEGGFAAYGPTWVHLATIYARQSAH